MRNLDLIAQIQGFSFHRIPWLWYDKVAARVTMPQWGLATLVFVALYIPSATFALLAGVLPEFLHDPSWPVLIGAVAFGSFLIGRMPKMLERLWASIRTWLVNPSEEITALEDETPRILMRSFWGIAIGYAALTVPYGFGFVPPPGVEPSALYVSLYSLLNLVLAPFVTYFVGGASALCTFGICTVAWRMSRALRFKQGFILQGGKAALRPFNSLLWMIWGAFALPIVAGTVLLVVTTPGEPGSIPFLFNLLALGVIVVLTVPTLIVPQLFMNRWLARQKSEELGELRRQLEQAAAPPAERNAYELLSRMQRHQHLVHQIQRADAFSPTLVDTRFVIQIGTSFTAILLANVALRTVLARLLP